MRAVPVDVLGSIILDVRISSEFSTPGQLKIAVIRSGGMPGTLFASPVLMPVSEMATICPEPS